MQRVFIILSVLLAVGCSVTQPHKNDLFGFYKVLANEVARSSVVENREKYFSDSYLSEVAVDDEKSTFVLEIPGQLNKVISHYQVVTSDVGCLTLNGLDIEGYPATLSVEYIFKNGYWLVNYMFLEFLEEQSSFKTEAVCPRDMG